MKIVLFDVDETLLSCIQVNTDASAIMFKKVFGLDTNIEKIN